MLQAPCIIRENASMQNKSAVYLIASKSVESAGVKDCSLCFM